MAVPHETLTGTVSTVNGTGFQITERPGVWLRISQYADPAPTLPTAGQRLRIGLDSKHFVRTVEPVAVDQPEGETVAQSESHSGKLESVRLACLQAAATFLASRPEAKLADVLTVAAKFEEWVHRSG